MSGLTILHGCRTLQLSKGKNTLVDEADFHFASRYRWHAVPSRNADRWYAVRNTTSSEGPCSKEPLHRALLGVTPAYHVDHRNRDGLDNRRANLRPATREQNARNQREARGSSRFKGVWRQMTCSGKTLWRSNIRANGKTLHLGSFKSEREAALAYDAAARKYHREFACTNADIYGDF